MSDILIYQTEDGRTQVNLLAQEHTVWLNQSQLAELFDTSVPNIATHIKNIFEDKELDEDSVIKDFLITAADGKQYQVKHYALEMILAVGFRVRSKRGVQFRRWANEVLTGYLEKGFALDDKRLRDEPLPDTLAIDASTLQQADSVGVAALVWLAALAARQQKTLNWQHLPPVLTELLALYEIDLPAMSQPCKKN